MQLFGDLRGSPIDLVTQLWVRATGRTVTPADVPWLVGPHGEVDGIGEDFFEVWAEAYGLQIVPAGPSDGLFETLDVLRSATFAPSDVATPIHDFYARTAAYDLRITTRWSRQMRPLGWLIARLFARRLSQLNMPLEDGVVRGGVRSKIVRLADGGGEVRHVGWVRTSARDGRPVFVGDYGTTCVPGHEGVCVKVVFPLPNGNAVVILRPMAEPDGGLSLVSDGRRFGDPGFTVRRADGRLHIRYVRTMKERLTLTGLGDDGVQALHRFWVFSLPFLDLHYTITETAHP